MVWVKIKRVIRAGLISFWRNSVVSLAAVLVMTVTLLVIGSLVFTGALMRSTINFLKDKVDINVYFVTSASENDILALKKSLEALPEVKSVGYVSRDQVLANFKSRHQDDQLTLQALDELKDNPLGAELNIKAKDTNNYESIAAFLKNENLVGSDQNSNSVIDKVNYNQNRSAIDKLTKISDSAQTLGLIIILILISISIVIIFNTIRLAIFISKDEIAVMRLVGASNRYIQGPFVVCGILYGVVSAFVTLAVFYFTMLWIGPWTSNFFTGLNLYKYYLENFSQIFILIFGTGIVLGAVSSYLSVRKHLKF